MYRASLLGIKNDTRVAIWDLYNEPSATNGRSYSDVELKDKPKYSRMLLEKTFAWAREVDPDQPLTAGFWGKGVIEDVAERHSDIITFHSYSHIANVIKRQREMANFGRPVICTEYLARSQQSFGEVLALFSATKTGAIHWGLVDGKTQTKHHWTSWGTPDTAEPDPWHHDLLHGDGSPYDKKEIDLISAIIREINGERPE